MKRMQSSRIVAAVGFALAILASGCSGDSGAAIDSILATQEGSTRVRSYESLAELTDRTESGDRRGVALVAMGTITDVAPGSSFIWVLEDDAERRVELEFGDSESESDTYHMTFEVGEVIASQIGSPSAVTVGLAVDPRLSLDDIKKDFLSEGKVLLFLENSPVYDDGIYGIVEDGALFGRIDQEGEVRFPALEDASSLLDGKSSLASVESLKPR